MIDYTSDIKEILRLNTDVTEEQLNSLTFDTNINSLGIDSLELVESIIEIEKKFHIDIEIGGAWMEELIVTIGDLNKTINEQVNG